MLRRIMTTTLALALAAPGCTLPPATEPAHAALAEELLLDGALYDSTDAFDEVELVGDLTLVVPDCRGLRGPDDATTTRVQQACYEELAACAAIADATARGLCEANAPGAAIARQPTDVRGQVVQNAAASGWSIEDGATGVFVGYVGKVKAKPKSGLTPGKVILIAAAIYATTRFWPDMDTPDEEDERECRSLISRGTIVSTMDHEENVDVCVDADGFFRSSVNGILYEGGLSDEDGETVISVHNVGWRSLHVGSFATGSALPPGSTSHEHVSPTGAPQALVFSLGRFGGAVGAVAYQRR